MEAIVIARSGCRCVHRTKVIKIIRRFGFVRFIKNPDQANLLEDLNKDLDWESSSAAYWGETVFVDEDADENIANGRFANRVPDFASLDNISQHDYESEASGNDQDIHSINESQEEGEINDKKEQMGYEMNAPGKSVDSFVRSEIIGETDEGCVKMYGKEIDDDILEDHFDGDRGNDTIEDNADVNPSTNVSLKVNIPEVANDSSIVSPSTPPGNDLNIAKESCY
ncbi:hypothetical protein Tco_0737519 [Tanacetum coccineum]